MVVSGIGSIFVFIGKLFITVITTVIAYGMIKKIPSLNDNIDSVLLPVVFCAIIAYVISAIFMMVYGMSMDTILICFYVDEDLN